jgi:hypothetical protein
MLALILVGVYIARAVETAMGGTSDYFVLIGIFFTAIWTFLFWRIYDKWMIHRKKIDGEWFEYARTEEGLLYYFDSNATEDPYA